MKTHILYIGLVLAAVALGTLAGSSLLAPAGVANEPQGGKGDIAPPVGVAIQPKSGKDGIAAPAPPGPGHDVLSQEIKLRRTFQGPMVTDWPHIDADGYLKLSMRWYSLAFTADGKTLAGAQTIADKKKEWTGAKLWDVATGKERASFPTGKALRWFALTADGKTLAVVSWEIRPVILWDVASGKETALVEVPLPLHPTVKEAAVGAEYGSVAFTPDGKTLAVGGLEAVKLWDVSTRKERACLKPCGPYCRVTFSADGKLLAAVSDSASSDPGKEIGAVTVWDVASGQQRDPLPDARGGFSSVAFTPDSKTLAAGGAGIVLWDVATCQKLATLKAHQGKVESLAFTADGKTLASAAGDSDQWLGSSWGQVKLWDMASGKVRATLKGFRYPPSSVAFAPDGRTLATFALGEIKLWDLPVSKQAAK